jgi:hypothetical protein
MKLNTLKLDGNLNTMANNRQLINNNKVEDMALRFGKTKPIGAPHPAATPAPVINQDLGGRGRTLNFKA